MQNGFDTGITEDADGLHRQRRRSSAPKIARDLLPAQPDAARPGYHTIFGSLILDDDPMDGSRSLRKRKASEGEEGASRPVSRKRMRRGTSEVSTKQTLYDEAGAMAHANNHAPASRVPESAGPTQRPSRTRNLRRVEKTLLTLDRSEDSLLAVFHLPPYRLELMAQEPQKRRRRERDRIRRAPVQRPEEEVAHYPALQPLSFTTHMLALLEREGDGNKSKPYGGILSEAEADTQKTFPQSPDRKKFEDARLKAEAGWKRKVQQQAASLDTSRPQKSASSASRIKCINFGGYEIDTWHDAPYPEEYSQSRVLYICEFCLKYMNSDFVAWRHKVSA